MMDLLSLIESKKASYFKKYNDACVHNAAKGQIELSKWTLVHNGSIIIGKISHNESSGQFGKDSSTTLIIIVNMSEK